VGTRTHLNKYKDKVQKKWINGTTKSKSILENGKHYLIAKGKSWDIEPELPWGRFRPLHNHVADQTVRTC
jgi:hypothetical protein